ncbi:MAG: hypothetical protein HOE80_01370 [Candidatus Magasanikbacteria bacterium]|jgi:hypothetical protein|nr:hypothetical protein [Candidatus Magasanikbacteria bacterium]MBT4071352.1 hypothetical protein [Candidatus Magasanikbacteria bacterium]
MINNQIVQIKKEFEEKMIEIKKERLKILKKHEEKGKKQAVSAVKKQILDI